FLIENAVTRRYGARLHCRGAAADAWQEGQSGKDPRHQPQDASGKTQEVRLRMKLRIVWTGKTKNSQLAKLCDDYAARIQHFLPLEIADVKEAKLLASLDSSDRVVVLDPKGKSWTSEGL